MLPDDVEPIDAFDSMARPEHRIDLRYVPEPFICFPEAPVFLFLLIVTLRLPGRGQGDLHDGWSRITPSTETVIAELGELLAAGFRRHISSSMRHPKSGQEPEESLDGPAADEAQCARAKEDTK